MNRTLTALLAAATLSVGLVPTSASAAVYICSGSKCIHLRGQLPTLEQCNRWAAGTSTVCFMSGLSTSSDSDTVVLGGTRQSLLILTANEERRMAAIVRDGRGAASVNRFQAMVSQIEARQPARGSGGWSEDREMRTRE